MRVRCPACGTLHRVVSANLPSHGFRGRCSKCGAVVEVAASSVEDPDAVGEETPPVPGVGQTAPATPASRRTSPPTPVTPPVDAPPGSSTAVTELDASRSLPQVGQQTFRSPDDLLDLFLEGEQNRREMTYHMTREILRLREAIEQQHQVLSEVARQVSDYAKLLPSPGAPYRRASDQPGSRLDEEDLGRRLREMEEALSREREIVERLRRSKLDLEKRVAQAEQEVDALRTQGQSLLNRLLGRHDG